MFTFGADIQAVVKTFSNFLIYKWLDSNSKK